MIFIEYKFVRDERKIYRNMYMDEILPGTLTANSNNGVVDALILEGVEDFSFNVWASVRGDEALFDDDSAVVTGREKISSDNASAISFDLELSNANPNTAEVLRERNMRNIKKTIRLTNFY